MTVNNDEIKYKLEKISIIQSGHISGWKSKQDSLINRMGNNQKLNDRERNPFLAVCGGAIPILLTFYSIDIISMEKLFEMLLIDIFIMLGVFIFYGIYNYKNTKIFMDIEKEVLESIQNMESLKNHIDVASFRVDQFNNENLEIVFRITKMTQGDSNIRYHNILKKAITSKLIQPQTKLEFKEIIKNANDLILEEIDFYKEFGKKINTEEWMAFTYLYESLRQESEKK